MRVNPRRFLVVSVAVFLMMGCSQDQENSVQKVIDYGTGKTQVETYQRLKQQIKTLEHKKLGRVPVLGWAARLSESEVEIEAASLLGEHTEQVLRAELGLGDADVAKLSDQKIIEIHRE